VPSVVSAVKSGASSLILSAIVVLLDFLWFDLDMIGQVLRYHII